MADKFKKGDGTINHNNTSSDEEDQEQELASFDTAFQVIQKQMSQPSSFVIIVLVLVISMLAFEFGSL